MRWVAAVSLLGLSGGFGLAAQLPAKTDAAGPGQPYVLHAYANLVQVPTLVLNADFRLMSALPIDQFEVRLDSGPVFHPVKMHLEGDEPISLAILLDASGDQNELLARFSEDFTQIAATSLRAHDHVSVFAVDCSLMRSAQYLPADSAELRQSVEDVFAAPALHANKGRAACGRSVHLWDAASTVIEALAHEPGHRVLMMVSTGFDHKSSTAWSQLEDVASVNSVTIFGVRDLLNFAGNYGYSNIHGLRSGVVFATGSRTEDQYVELCERNGGIILTTPPANLATTLRDIVAMLRGRYILEFPRPDDASPGRHVINVTLKSYRAFIATAAVEVALPQDNRDSDPTTVKSSPSPAVLGKRHGLKSN